MSTVAVVPKRGSIEVSTHRSLTAPATSTPAPVYCEFGLASTRIIGGLRTHVLQSVVPWYV